MHLLKPISAVAHWTAAGNNFDRLSPDERRLAWLLALVTHFVFLPVTYLVVELAPALGATFADYVVMHFLITLLFARVAGIASGVWELAHNVQLIFERNGCSRSK